MDDAVLLHPAKERLRAWQRDIEHFCQAELRLQLHPRKTGLHKFTGRERFVGYDLAPFRRRLSKPTVQRFVRRMRRVEAARGPAAAEDSWRQFLAYSDFAHARGLLRSIGPPFITDSLAEELPRNG